MRRQRLTQQWLTRRVHWFARRLKFTNWKIKVQLVTIPPEDDAIADCDALPEYLEATLRFDPAGFKTSRQLDHLIIHELGHLHTWHLAQLAEELAGEDEFKGTRVLEALELATTHWDQVVGALLVAPPVKLIFSRRKPRLAPPEDA